MSISTTEVSWRIRSLTQSDMSQMLSVERQAHSHPWTEWVFKDCLRSDYRFSGVVDGSEELAAFCVVANLFDEAHLLNICVLPSYQGQGLGRKLLGYLIGEAKNDGMERLLLEVRQGNSKALRLYKSEGFERIGLRKGYYPSAQGREDAVVLSLLLL